MVQNASESASTVTSPPRPAQETGPPEGAVDQVRFEVITTPSGFEDLQGPWKALLEASSYNEVFLTWEWMFSWWQAFGGELFVVVAYEQRDPVGIFPFISARKPGFVQLKLMGTPDSDYQGVILKSDEEATVLTAFFRDFLGTYPEIGLIELPSVNERHGHLIEAIRSPPPGWHCHVTHEKQCPAVVFEASTTWDGLLSGLSKSTRKSVRRRLRQLERPNVNIRTESDPESLEERMNDFFELHNKRWKSLERPGYFRSKRVRFFHQTLAQRFLEPGYLRLYCLEIDGQPAATDYVFWYNQRAISYQSGFDPRFHSYGPGFFIMTYAIRKAVEDGLLEYDFSRGTARYKYSWNPLVRVNRSFVLWRRSMAVQVYVAARRGLMQLSQLYENSAPKKLKKGLRLLVPRRVRQIVDPYSRPDAKVALEEDSQ